MTSKARIALLFVLLAGWLFAAPQPGEAAFHFYANLVLGQPDFISGSANQGGAPASDTLNFPQSILLDANGSLFVADTSNNRVLRYDPPLSSSQPASLVLGQANFTSMAPNRGLAPAANSLSLPDGLAMDSSGNLYIADFGNNRVLRFSPPFTSGMDASLVLGQADFTSTSPNRGGSPGPGTINSPAGLVVGAGGELFVADNSNHRILRFPASLTNGVDADLVLGQADFNWGCANRCAATAANSLYAPTGLALDNAGNLFIADTYNHRLLKFSPPMVNGMDASLVLGQANFTAGSANRGGALSAGSLSEPHAVVMDDWGNLFIADYGNNRLVEYDSPASNGVNANNLFGQQGWNQNLANNAGLSSASLFNPIDVALDVHNNLFTADRGNNRLLRFPQPVAPGVPAPTALSPSVIAVGGWNFTLEVNGSGFMPNSIVHLNGGDRPTTFISSKRLSAAIPAADIQSNGSVNITVFTPAPGGGESAPLSLTLYERATFDKTADLVFGQANFASTAIKFGASGLKEPVNLAIDAYDRLYVADTKNNRILRYSRPFYNGQPADLVIGQADFNATLANRGALAPAANTLNGPKGVAVDVFGKLYVSDSGNNRVLIYNPPFTNGMDARVVLGHPNFSTQYTGVGPTSLSDPGGLALNSNGQLIVADSGYNRVMVFDSPFSTNQPAALLFGQQGFWTGGANQGLATPNAFTLWYPYLVAADDTGFFVSDEYNQRLLRFDISSPKATMVLGQPDFYSNMVMPPTAESILAPGGMALDKQGNLYVTDYYYHRLLVFRAPLSTWMSASLVLGQPDFGSKNLFPASANTLNYPQGVALDSMGYLFVADQRNSRVVEFDQPLSPAAPQSLGLSSSILAAGSPDARLTVIGKYFESTSLVRWNGSARATTYVSPTELRAVIPAADLTSLGVNNVTVETPPPGGGLSIPLTVTLYATSPLDRQADLVLGQGSFKQNTENRFGLSADGLAHPQGAVLDGLGNLYVADALNHRVLRYDAPLYAGKSASLVFGATSLRIPGSGMTLDWTLSNPVAVALDKNGRLYVADFGHRRVVRFSPPFSSGMAADLVLGQPDFVTMNNIASAAVLGGPVSLALDGQGNLYVADQINNRVLRFDSPLSSGMAASLVIGQSAFNATSPNRGGAVNASGLSSPYGLALDGLGSLLIADQYNNRVLKFSPPYSSGMSASLVLGQGDFSSNAANRGIACGANTLNNPAGLIFDAAGTLFVADYGNQRILKFGLPLANGANALGVFGQPGFTTTTINNGGVSASSLRNAVSLAVDMVGNLYAADAGNNRMLVFYHFPFQLSLPLVRR